MTTAARAPVTVRFKISPWQPLVTLQKVDAAPAPRSRTYGPGSTAGRNADRGGWTGYVDARFQPSPITWQQ
jgi:hypothetical protein